jgi:hypothetical protein
MFLNRTQPLLPALFIPGHTLAISKGIGGGEYYLPQCIEARAIINSCNSQEILHNKELCGPKSNSAKVEKKCPKQNPYCALQILTRRNTFLS